MSHANTSGRILSQWRIGKSRHEAISSSAHREHDLADLRVAQHVRMRIGEPLERKRAIKYRLERTGVNRCEQIGGETFTRLQCLLGRARTESHTDDRRAFAGDFIHVALADECAIAPDADQPALERE